MIQKHIQVRSYFIATSSQGLYSYNIRQTEITKSMIGCPVNLIYHRLLTLTVRIQIHQSKTLTYIQTSQHHSEIHHIPHCNTPIGLNISQQHTTHSHGYLGYNSSLPLTKMAFLTHNFAISGASVPKLKLSSPGPPRCPLFSVNMVSSLLVRMEPSPCLLCVVQFCACSFSPHQNKDRVLLVLTFHPTPTNHSPEQRLQDI